MTTNARPPNQAPAPKGLAIALWIVQFLLGLTLMGTAVWKVVTPVADLAAKMPWMGEVSTGFLRTTAAFDFLAGAGVILPSLTRIRPRLTVLGALGCVGLMVGAIVFHISRGEAANTPFNFVVIGLALFVAWGRWFKAPIASR